MDFLRDKLNRSNQIIYLTMACACSFSYYLINFYVKYLPGDIYTNQIVNSISESFSNASGMFVVMLMSQKKGFAISYLGCAISCALVLIAESTEANWLVPVAVIMAKSTITVAFSLLYFTIVDFFES